MGIISSKTKAAPSIQGALTDDIILTNGPNPNPRRPTSRAPFDAFSRLSGWSTHLQQHFRKETIAFTQLYNPVSNLVGLPFQGEALHLGTLFEFVSTGRARSLGTSDRGSIWRSFSKKTVSYTLRDE